MEEEKRVDVIFLKILKKLIYQQVFLEGSRMSAWPPRTYVERIFNIKQWGEHKSGGHFAAMEQPELLVNDIVKFAKKIS